MGKHKRERACGFDCGFKGTVPQVEGHERICPRQQYECACAFTGTQEEVKEHAQACDQALPKCPCGFTGSAADVEQHSLKCTDAVFQCDYECGYNGTRRQVEQHEEICSDDPLLRGAASSGTAVKKRAVRGLQAEIAGLTYRDPFMGKRNTLAPDAPPARSVGGYQVRDSAVPVAVTQVSRESGSDSVDQKAEGGSASAECGKPAMDATDTSGEARSPSGNMEIASDGESSDGTVPRLSIFLPDLPIISGKPGEEILISSDDEVDGGLPDVVLMRGWPSRGEQVSPTPAPAAVAAPAVVAATNEVIGRRIKVWGGQERGWLQGTITAQRDATASDGTSRVEYHVAFDEADDQWQHLVRERQGNRVPDTSGMTAITHHEHHRIWHHDGDWLDLTFGEEDIAAKVKFAIATPHVEETVTHAMETQRLTENSSLLTRGQMRHLRQNTAVQVPRADESDIVKASNTTLRSILRPAPVVAPASAAGSADDPAHDLNDEFCFVCKGAAIDKEPKEPLYCCDSCSRSFHEFCIKDLYAPNLTADDLPDRWYGHVCEDRLVGEGGGGGGGGASSRDADREANTASKKKRKPQGRR